MFEASADFYDSIYGAFKGYLGEAAAVAHRVGRNACDFNGMHIVRTSTVEVDGRLSRLRFDYEITAPSGIRRASEVHELGLFAGQELTKMFQAAGLQVDYDSKGLSNRGLYVAVKVA